MLIARQTEMLHDGHRKDRDTFHIWALTDSLSKTFHCCLNDRMAELSGPITVWLLGKDHIFWLMLSDYLSMSFHLTPLQDKGAIKSVATD